MQDYFIFAVLTEESKYKLIMLTNTWASPRETSEKKGQRQKVTFKFLNMKESKATGYKSKYLANFFCVLGPFWSYWVWAKKCLIFKNQIF